MAKVRGLGYVVVEATDLDAWVEFGAGLLGMQVAERSAERILFRVDEMAWRVEVRLAGVDRMATVGWEVEDAAALTALEQRLIAAGHVVRRPDRQECRDRQVVEMVRFDDPDGVLSVELYYGLQRTTVPFASPNGVQFVTGECGLGHVNQSVLDHERYRELYIDILGFKVSDHIQYEIDKETIFMHCNPRHHSYGYGHRPATPPAVGHLMLEARDIKSVGQAWDKVFKQDAAPILSAMGQHTNDEMVSFYVRSPSGFGLEFGCGGVLVDEETWVVRRYDEAHYWGHYPGTPPDPQDPALMDEESD